jgi:cob(I)alamin adenosyltransferase
MNKMSDESIIKLAESCAVLTFTVEIYEERIKTLEKKISELEDRINRMENFVLFGVG